MAILVTGVTGQGQVVAVRSLVDLDVGNVDDLEAVVLGEGRWSLEMIQATMKHPHTRLSVAEMVATSGQTSFADYCALQVKRADGEVATIGVDEASRRVGVGRKMMSVLVDRARASGCRR